MMNLSVKISLLQVTVWQRYKLSLYGVYLVYKTRTHWVPWTIQTSENQNFDNYIWQDWIKTQSSCQYLPRLYAWVWQPLSGPWHGACGRDQDESSPVLDGPLLQTRCPESKEHQTWNSTILHYIFGYECASGITQNCRVLSQIGVFLQHKVWIVAVCSDKWGEILHEQVVNAKRIGC